MPDAENREFLGYSPKIKKEIEIIEVLLAMIIIALCIISLISYNILKVKITAGVETYGLLGLFIVSSVIEFIPNFFHPILGLLVAVASGIKVYSAIISTILGSILGSILGFELGKAYGFKFICNIFDRITIQKLLDFKNKYGNFVMFLAAVTPLPYLPMVFGAVSASRKDFIVYGLLPRILSYIVIGYLLTLGILNY